MNKSDVATGPTGRDQDLPFKPPGASRLGAALLWEALAEVGLDGIIDIHVHPLPILSEEELLGEIREAGVRRCVLLALDVDAGDLEGPDRKLRFMEEMFNAGIWNPRALENAIEILRLARTPNERVAELVEKHESLFLGFGSVNPARSSSYVADKLGEIGDLGLRGVKLIPTLQLFCPHKAKRNLRKILKFCRREGLVAMFHTGCDPGPWESPALSECARPAYLAPFIRSFSQVDFVLAHAGSYSSLRPGIWFHEAVELASRYPNVWLDVAAVPYLLTEPDFVGALRGRGLLSRVLFGSDYPVIGGSGVKEVAEIILSSTGLTVDEKAGVMALNAERLLGL